MYIYATICIWACTALASCTHNRPHSFLQRRRARPARECRMWEFAHIWLQKEYCVGNYFINTRNINAINNTLMPFPFVIVEISHNDCNVIRMNGMFHRAKKMWNIVIKQCRMQFADVRCYIKFQFFTRWREYFGFVLWFRRDNSYFFAN